MHSFPRNVWARCTFSFESLFAMINTSYFAAISAAAKTGSYFITARL